MRPRSMLPPALAGAILLTGLTFAAGAPAAAEPYCGITWGSLEKAATHYSGAPVTGVRAGKHECWERLVIDLGGMPAPGYRVRYVDALRNQETGRVEPVAGGAVLSITARSPAGNVPWRWGTHVIPPEQFRAGGFQTLCDLVYAGTYEGSTDFALGVRARLPFRVFGLSGPGGGSRLVIDVAHRW